MRRLITDSEAHGISRTPKPTPGTIKQVLAWAKAAPSPDKIGVLLALESDNYASRKGLDDEVQEALLACALHGKAPLWEAVETDRDYYKVWHALRVLASIGDPGDIQRMIELGRTQILRIHWDVILEAAKKNHIEIPTDICERQKHLESIRGKEDFYEYFLARKATNSKEAKSSAISKTTRKKVQAGKVVAPVFPAVFSEQGESNRFLEDFKRARKERWTVKRMEGLFEETDLALYLTALERKSEALAVLFFLTNSTQFAGNYNIWTPVCYALCVQARLLRQDGKEQEAASAMQRIRENPFQDTQSESEVREAISRLPSDLQSAFQEKSTRWACQNLSRVLQSVCFYIETAHGNFDHARWYSAEKLETTMCDGLRMLRQRLESR